VTDAVAGHSSHILRGNGKGQFVDIGTFVVSNISTFPHLMAADLNGDNLADLVSTGDGNTIAVQLNATPPDFLFDVSPANVPPVVAGGSATLTLTPVAQAGFGGDIMLSCSSPSGQGINCSLSPSSVAPGSSTTLTLTTTGSSAAPAPRGRSIWLLYASCLPTLGFAFVRFGFAVPHQRNASRANVVLCIFLCAGMLLQAACGGTKSDSGSHATPAGTYTITVTGISGSTQHSTTTTLTVL
jgi:serine protease AprX